MNEAPRPMPSYVGIALAPRIHPRVVGSVMMVGVALVVAAIFVANLLAWEPAPAASLGIIAVAVVINLVLILIAFAPTKRLVTVAGDRICIDGRTPGYPISNVQLLPWLVIHHGTTQGSALRLGGRPRPFILGGKDHRLGFTPGGRPVRSVDAYMDDEQFDKLLLTVFPDYKRWSPVRDRDSPRRTLIPYGGSVTFRRRPALTLDVTEDWVNVLDAATSARWATAPRALAEATPAQP